MCVGSTDSDASRTLAIVLGSVAGLIVIVVAAVGVGYWAQRSTAVNRRERVLRAEMAAYDGPGAVMGMSPRNGAERSRASVERLPSAPELTTISLAELDAEAARQQPKSVRKIRAALSIWWALRTSPCRGPNPSVDRRVRWMRRAPS